MINSVRQKVLKAAILEAENIEKNGDMRNFVKGKIVMARQLHRSISTTADLVGW